MKPIFNNIEETGELVKSLSKHVDDLLKRNNKTHD